ncbi:MAG: hypothetical protein ACRYF0_11010 [Janthinobacterium lividum]
MEFDLLLTNRLKLLGCFCLLVGLMVLAAVIWVFLDSYNNFLCAAVGTMFFFMGGWLLLSIDKLAGEPVRITIKPSEIIVWNQLTGNTEAWPFDAIVAYKFFPPFRGRAILRLTLRAGAKVKLLALDMGITSTANTSRLVSVVTAFGGAWRLHQQGQH